MCGEGGEYESLTLDCPLFTHGRIVLDSWEAVLVSEDSLAPVALLHPTAFHVEPKPAGGSGNGSMDSSGTIIAVPDDWSPPRAALEQAGAADAAAAASAAAAEAQLSVQLSVAEGASYCSLTASVFPPPASAGLDVCSAEGTVAALAAALRALSGALPALGLDWQASLFVHLYVPSMAQFAAANAAYAAVLPAVNPPSRATVQLAACGGGGGGGAGPALVVDVLFARWGGAGKEGAGAACAGRQRPWLHYSVCTGERCLKKGGRRLWAALQCAPALPTWHLPASLSQGACRAACAARAEHQPVGALLHRPLLTGHTPCGAGAVCGAGALPRGGVRQEARRGSGPDCLLKVHSQLPLTWGSSSSLAACQPPSGASPPPRLAPLSAATSPRRRLPWTRPPWASCQVASTRNACAA